MMTGSALPTYQALKERLLEDLATNRRGTVKEVEFMLWRRRTHGSPIADPAELAPHVLRLIEACVHEHLDVPRLARDVAALLRESQPVRFGIAPMEEYEKFGVSIVRDYVHPAPPPPSYLIHF